MAGVETSIENMITQINGQYFSMMNKVNAYGDLKLWDMKEPDIEVLLPTTEERPTISKAAYKTSGDRLFTPDDITDGGFPEYVPPAEIDWNGLYSALTTHKDRVWESAEMDTLIAKMQGLILGDEAWLTADYQANAFDLDRDRRLQTLDDSLRLITSRFAARNFRIPTSMLSTQENVQVLNYQMDNKNQSRELAKAVIEAARNFQQFAIGKGMDYEQINMQFTEAYNLALLEPIKLKVETYMKQIETAANVFGNRVKEIMMKFDAEKASWALTNTYNENLFKAESFPWQMYKLEVDATIEKARIQLEEFNIKITADMNALVNGFKTMGQMVQTGSSITLTTKKPA